MPKCRRCGKHIIIDTVICNECFHNEFEDKNEEDDPVIDSTGYNNNVDRPDEDEDDLDDFIPGNLLNGLY